MSTKAPEMRWGGPSDAASLRTFRERMELFLEDNDVRDKPKQATKIRIALGDEGTRMLQSSGLTGDDKKDPDKIWDYLEGQLDSDKHVSYRVHRLQFTCFRQAPKESTSEFVSRLRLKAKLCQFGESELTERLLEQVILCTPIEEFRHAMLKKVKGYEVGDAVKLANQYEAVAISSASIRSMSTVQSSDTISEEASINALKGNQSQHKQCGNCGRKHPPRQCPAYKDECRACKRKGHWAKYCRQTRHQRGETADTDRPTYRPTNIHALDATPQLPTSEDLHFDTVSAETRREARAELSCHLPQRGTATLVGKVDTGASDSVMPARTFRKMFPERVGENGALLGLTTSKARLTAYNGTPIKHYGTVTILSKFQGGNFYECSFYVAETPGPVIFGLPMCTQLGLVTLNCAVCTVHDITKSDSEAQIKGPVLSTYTKSETSVGCNVHRDVSSLTAVRVAFPHCFQGIGHFSKAHTINLQPNPTPVAHAPRRTPIHLQAKIKAELERMESLGVIRKVEEPTDWVSSVAYAIKGDGSLRVCLDPSDLNGALRSSKHHIPTIEEISHKFAGAQVFSKLDAKHGYWAIELDPDSQLLTTFNSPFGRYCFRRLPFGLRTSQDVFQSAMDNILRDLPGVVSIADDIVVFGKNRHEHDQHLVKLLERASVEGLVFNPNKCEINAQEVKFFGNIYSASGVRPDPAKVEAIRGLATPATKKELQVFLGMVTYLSTYIPNLSRNTDTLRKLLKQEEEFQWHHENIAAFNTLKNLIGDAETMPYFDPRKETTIQVDASLSALGAALMQDGRVVAFASKALSEVESRYANIEREMLACVFGAERFHTYIFGKRFVIKSDHKPLTAISKKNLTAAPPRLQRMLMRLQHYDYIIDYVPGTDVPLADCLSRARQTTHKSEHIELDVHVCHVQHSQERLLRLREATASDPETSELKNVIVTGFPDRSGDLSRRIRHYWSYRDELSIDDGLILKGERVLIPLPLRTYYLDKIHQGHQGVTKCQLLARSCVYWPGIDNDIGNTVRACSECQRHQASQPQLPMMPLAAELPQIPWHTISADLFSLEGRNYLIICDYYTRYPVVEQLSGPSSSLEVAQICSQTFALFGIPVKIISDNGPHFIGNPFHEMTKRLGIVHSTSSPHPPRSHGFIERTIRTIKGCIKKTKHDTDMALLNLRTTPIDGSTPSPGELLFGRRIGTMLPNKISNKAEKPRRSLHQPQDPEPDGLPVGCDIYYRDVAQRIWRPGMVMGIGPEPRSYTIQCTTSGQHLRRNLTLIRRRHTNLQHTQYRDQPLPPVHPMNGTFTPSNVTVTMPAEPCQHQDQDIQTETSRSRPIPPDMVPSTMPDTPSTTIPYHTRSGRTVRQTQRFIENT